MPRECVISLEDLRTVPKALLSEPITMLPLTRRPSGAQAGGPEKLDTP